MSDKFHSIYRIPSIRLPNWDYSKNGYYFITICTKNRINYFGNVVNNQMKLSTIGEIAQKYWKEIPMHSPFVELNEFMVMPNHLHGILIINNVFPNVETPNLGVSTKGKIKFNKWSPGCLGVIINQYKRICTINIRQICSNFSWQSRFYEHIIRNEHELARIRQYIRVNSANWEKDINNSFKQ